MILEIIRAFLLTFIAEMGDKTQIIAMTFASKYRVKEVLLGVVLGVVLNHGLAILFGRVFLKFIPIDYVQLLAGFIFIVFAYLSLLDDKEEEEEAGTRSYGPVVTVALAFFLGELGDKTQLMAMTLSVEASYPLLILCGTTLGMVATSGLGIFVGSKIGSKLPDLYIKLTSSVVFLIFGILKIMGLLDWNMKWVLLGLIVILEIILIFRLIKSRKDLELSPMQLAAEKLYLETQLIKEAVDNICLGEAVCGHCDGQSCLLGYIRNILDDARLKGDYSLEESSLIEELKQKNFDDDKVLKALATIIYTVRKNNWKPERNFVVDQIARYLEEYLLGEALVSPLASQEYIEEFRLKNSSYGLRLERILSGLRNKK